MNNLVKALFAMCAMSVASDVSASVILATFDLTTPDSLTISATNEVSQGTVSGTDFTGVYFADFYVGTSFIGAGIAEFNVSGLSGDFVYASSTSDGSPSAFRGTFSSDPGFNLWSLDTGGLPSFTAGEQAFTGSAIGTVDSTLYGQLFALGNQTGNVFAFTDNAGSAGSATLIGQYEIITSAEASVPAPPTLALLLIPALLMVAVRRNRLS